MEGDWIDCGLDTDRRPASADFKLLEDRDGIQDRVSSDWLAVLLGRQSKKKQIVALQSALGYDHRYTALNRTRHGCYLRSSSALPVLTRSWMGIYQCRRHIFGRAGTDQTGSCEENVSAEPSTDI